MPIQQLRSVKKQTTKINNFHDKFNQSNYSLRSPHKSPLKSIGKSSKIKGQNEETISIMDRDVDGLLNWANNLPGEDAFNQSGTSFFVKGI